MAETSPTTTRRPRAWGRIPGRFRVGALLVLLAVLVGRGLGWFGRDGSAATPTEAALVLAPQVPPAGEPGRAAEPPAPAPVPAVPAAPLVEVATVATPAVDPDRFGSLLSLLQTETEAQQFGRALALLQQLRDLPLDEAQRAALVLPAEALQQGLAAACGTIVGRLVEGRVLAADAAAGRLLAGDGGSAAPALVEALQLLGVAGALGGLPAAGAAPWPTPARLPKGRLVRTHLAGEEIVGRVVDSRADELTLRVQRGDRVTFPTLLVVGCEPVDPSAAEAVEMGFAALQQGRGRLARLWLGCALLRLGPAAPAPRLQRLAELLR